MNKIEKVENYNNKAFEDIKHIMKTELNFGMQESLCLALITANGVISKKSFLKL